MDMAMDLHLEASAVTSLGGSLASTEEVTLSQKRKRARKKKQGKAVQHNDEGPDFRQDGSSLKTDAAVKDPLLESPALPNLSSSQRTVEHNSKKKNRKRKRQKIKHKAIESNVKNVCDAQTSIDLSKAAAPTLDTPSEHQIQSLCADPSTTESCVEMDIHQGKAVQHNDEGPDLRQDGSSRKTDAAVKDPLLESPALPNLSSSQRIVEHNSKKKRKRRKRQKIKHKAIESNVKNVCDAPTSIDSSKAATPTLDMPSEHQIQSLRADPSMTESCVERDIHQGENEKKDHNMLKKAAENSNGKCDIEEARCIRNSVVANAECFTEESGLEVAKLNVEQGISNNTSNPEGESSVKSANKVKIHDDYPLVCQLSRKSHYSKTYSRRKIVNSNYGKNCACPNFNNETTMQDRHKDDSHELSEGPLTVGLMEKETNGRQTDHIESSRNDMCGAGDVSDLSLVSIKDSHSKISNFSLNGAATSTKNKLLILDVNGVLADFVNHYCRGPEPDLKLKRRKVYKRPFCDDFLQFCFERFHVGVWSSRAKYNVDKVVEHLMGKFASKLLFCWNQSHCTRTQFTTVENTYKPILLKELWKLWEKVEPGLPWEKGEFNESNTVLLDDSPCKALLNPMHTAIFPYSYQYTTEDTSLGPGGDLRVYLEGLAMAENVQEYVSMNPFGQRPIRETNPSWEYYQKVIEAVKRSKNYRRRNARLSTPGR